MTNGAGLDSIRTESCINKHCVKPGHLEAVTHRENTLRGDSYIAKRARQKRCIHGHDFDEKNTYIASDGTRHCRKCRNENIKARYWRAKELAAAS